MIKVKHTHNDGTTCYICSTDISQPGIYIIGGKQVFIGYKPYTGHYYAYNEQSGKEIATFSSEFFETFIKSHRMAQFVADPDCK